jgi:hypothetical protein
MPTGLQVRAPGNRRGAVQLCAPSNRLAYGCVLQNLVAGTKQNTGANAEGTTATKTRSGGRAIPTRRPGFGTDRTVSSLLSPRPMPNTRWRVAQLAEQRVLVPTVEGSNPSPPAMNTPGECRADYSSNLSPSAQTLVPRTRNTPANAVRHYRLSPSWSRVRIPPCAHSHVAQLDKARRVAKPLSPGP